MASSEVCVLRCITPENMLFSGCYRPCLPVAGSAEVIKWCKSSSSRVKPFMGSNRHGPAAHKPAPTRSWRCHVCLLSVAVDLDPCPLMLAPAAPRWHVGGMVSRLVALPRACLPPPVPQPSAQPPPHVTRVLIHVCRTKPLTAGRFPVPGSSPSSAHTSIDGRADGMFGSAPPLVDREAAHRAPGTDDAAAPGPAVRPTATGERRVTDGEASSGSETLLRRTAGHWSRIRHAATPPSVRLRSGPPNRHVMGSITTRV